jgi:hypothetical protein
MDMPGPVRYLRSCAAHLRLATPIHHRGRHSRALALDQLCLPPTEVSQAFILIISVTSALTGMQVATVNLYAVSFILRFKVDRTMIAVHGT